MEAVFRKATEEDLPEMMALADLGRAFLRDQGVDQWQMGDPNQEGLRQDIARGESWVICQNGRVMGMLALTAQPDPTYVEIDGTWANSEPYPSVHRMATHPDARGTGLATTLLQQAMAQTAAAGYTTIRVDTHHQNLPMQRLLQKNGFVIRGDLVLQEGAEKGRARLGLDWVAM